MESNWRLNIGEVGWRGLYNYFFPEYGYMSLCARLTTPFVIGPVVCPWIVEFTTPTGRSGAYGFASLQDPRQIGGFIFTFFGRFPYGLSVFPDN